MNTQLATMTSATSRLARGHSLVWLVGALAPLTATAIVSAQATQLAPDQPFSGSAPMLGSIAPSGPNVVAVESTGDDGDWYAFALDTSGQLDGGSRYFGDPVFTNRVRVVLTPGSTTDVELAGGPDGFYAEYSAVDTGFDQPADNSIVNAGGGSIAFWMAPTALVRARQVYLSGGNYNVVAVQHDQVLVQGAPEDTHQDFALLVVPPTADNPIGLITSACDSQPSVTTPAVAASGYTCPSSDVTGAFASRLAGALGNRTLTYVAPTDGWYTFIALQANHDVTNSVRVTVTPRE